VSELKLLSKKDKFNSQLNFFPNQDTTLGQTLRFYREEKNLTLEEVSEKTYIKLKYLKALEEDSTEEMPSIVYVYSYIKHYAKLLGINSDELVKLYQKQYNIKSNSKDDELTVGDLEQKFKIETQCNKMMKKDKNQENFDSLFDNSINNELEYINDDIKNRPIEPFLKKSENTLGSIEKKVLSEINSNVLERKEMQKDIGDNSLNLSNKDIVFEPDKKVKKQAEEILSDAREEAKLVINQAREESTKMILRAREEAEQIILASEKEAHQLRSGAKNYAEQTLNDLASDLHSVLDIVRNGRNFIRESKNKK